MEAITLAQLLEAVHGTLLGDFRDENVIVQRVDTDSRTIHPAPCSSPWWESGSTGTPTSTPPWRGALWAASPPGNGRATAPTDSISRWPAPSGPAGPGRMVQGPIPHPLHRRDGQRGQDHHQGHDRRRAEHPVPGAQDRGNYNNNIGLPLTLLGWTGAVRSACWRWGWTARGRSTTWGRSSSRTWESSPTSGTPTSSAWAAGRTSSGPSASCCPTSGPAGWWCSTGDDPMLASLRGRTPVPAVFCGREEGLGTGPAGWRGTGTAASSAR